MLYTKEEMAKYRHNANKPGQALCQHVWVTQQSCIPEPRNEDGMIIGHPNTYCPKCDMKYDDLYGIGFETWSKI